MHYWSIMCELIQVDLFKNRYKQAMIILVLTLSAGV
jgi:hypothetical protein